LIVSGARFAAATMSAMVFQGAPLWVASTSGPMATRLTGAKACITR
jgi:hypothetical protein